MRVAPLPILLLLSLATPVGADGVPVRDGPAAAELVSEYAPFRPGRSVTLAVILHLDEGWHAYWVNPGDAGQPPEIEWTLPEGFEVGLLEWPAPHRLVEGPIVSFVYEGELVLPVTLYVPEDAPEGEATVAAKVKWLACNDQCLPGQAEVSLTRPVRAGLTKVDERAHQMISRTRALLPVPLDAEARHDPAGGRVVLSVERREGSPEAFFPEAEGMFDLASLGAPHIAGEGARWETDLALANPTEVPERLIGVLVTKDPRRAYAVSAVVTRGASDDSDELEEAAESGLSALVIMMLTGAGLILLLLVAIALLGRGRGTRA